MPAESQPEPAKYDDVRMRGFKSRQQVADVLTWVDQNSNVLETEDVALNSAAGRVLGADVVSTLNVPAFRRAMMDGYALHASDTSGATNYNALTLQIVGDVLPGSAFGKNVGRGEAVSIMTGAPLPNGADAVLPAERAARNRNVLTLMDEVSPGKHVGRIGEDIAENDVVLRAGRVLRPQDVGVLSSIGKATVNVVRRPRVRLIITGNELCAAGSTPSENQTVDANSPMLAALIARDGGTLLFDGITSDDPDVLRAAMLEDADVVIVSGGSSVGQEDHAPRVLAETGELNVHGIAMRPSSPSGMGRIAERSVFLLPGNPVSCLCAYDFFAGRCVRLRGGRPAEWPYRTTIGTLRRKISSVVGRHDYARVAIDENQNVDPIAISGASALSSTSRADGFVLVPTDSEGYPPGANVKVFLYD